MVLAILSGSAVSYPGTHTYTHSLLSLENSYITVSKVVLDTGLCFTSFVGLKVKLLDLRTCILYAFPSTFYFEKAKSDEVGQWMFWFFFFFFTLEAQNLKHQRLVSLRLKSWICLKPFLVHGLIRQRIQLYTK